MNPQRKKDKCKSERRSARRGGFDAEEDDSFENEKRGEEYSKMKGMGQNDDRRYHCAAQGVDAQLFPEGKAMLPETLKPRPEHGVGI
ncbi:hypothetical protein FACS1894161_0670 [Spirochaetia bacterium]|nr:hypothetical protein FACS1894161_0670 [Spirochaetia bacterium]